ncbi:unnamed protein product [Effrenium voratum]|uniref:Uncharacterized protein n=1 Tax=Effrenium voratum TaxID=2562239 RepID=A0AA36IXM0_9DINO|nr:unnamed protein product [Effrenium voratum]
MALELQIFCTRESDKILLSCYFLSGRCCELSLPLDATFRELSARLDSQILAVRVRKNEVAWSTKEAPPEQRVLNVLGGNSVAQRSTYSSLGGSVLSLPFASNQTRVTWLPCFPFPWTFEARLSFARGRSR